VTVDLGPDGIAKLDELTACLGRLSPEQRGQLGFKNHYTAVTRSAVLRYILTRTWEMFLDHDWPLCDLEPPAGKARDSAGRKNPKAVGRRGGK